MKRNWVKTIALLLAPLIAAASGCTPNISSADASPTPTREVLLASTPAPTPVAGGTLRLSMPANADKTDPLDVNTEDMMYLYSLVFESLITIDDSGQLAPELAENWQCDETGRVWTLKLRSAARWHDTGASITAADVIYTFDKLKAAGSASYYNYDTKRIESISAGESNTVVVTMKEAGYASLYALTFPIVESTSTATGNYPAGTGPYRFSYVSDDMVKLSASTNWWKEDPYIESIEFYSRDSNEVSLASFVAGQLDMVMTSSLSVGRYRDEGNAAIMDVMTETCETMLINFSNQYLRDVNIRKAIAYAINRSSIITNVYMNRARASDVPVPPDSWVYESKSKLYDYDTETALSLFAESGWADTDDDGYLELDGQKYSELTLRLLVNDSTDTARKTAAELIASQLEDIGIHVEVVSAGYTLGDSESEYVSMLQSGDFDLALVGFNLGRDCDLTGYLSASGSRNYGGYNNAALETISRNILTAADSTEYRAAVSELQLRFVEELPFITLYFRLNSILYRSTLKGLTSAREPDIMRTVASWYIG